MHLTSSGQRGPWEKCGRRDIVPAHIAAVFAGVSAHIGQLKAAVGARAAVRFLQTEIMLDDLPELQAGSQIPLIP